MNKHLTAILAILTGLISSTAYAAPGEYWEITSKMEIPGMPFAMPATTTKICIAKGNENDPRKTSGDKDCQMSDIKTVGKKTTFKVRCDRDGEIMTGTGEQTVNANGSESKIHFSGKSRGRDTDMTMTSSSKRIGGSCDSGEAVKKAKEDQQKITAQMCDTSGNRNTVDWIRNSSMLIQKGRETLCPPALRNQLCELVRKDAPNDIETYRALTDYEQQSQSVALASMVKECKLNMAAVTKSICKKLNGNTYEKLSAHCPAEAKAYREIQRRKYCEGREYTSATPAEELKKCLSGKDDNPSADDESANNSAPSGGTANVASKKTKPGKSKTDENQNDSANSGEESSTSSDMLQGAKKLKGMFGF